MCSSSLQITTVRRRICASYSKNHQFTHELVNHRWVAEETLTDYDGIAEKREEIHKTIHRSIYYFVLNCYPHKEQPEIHGIHEEK